MSETDLEKMARDAGGEARRIAYQLGQPFADPILATGLTVIETTVIEAIQKATESLRSELDAANVTRIENFNGWQHALKSCDQLRTELAEARRSFELQRRNYIELCEAVLGDGSTTSEVKDICAIAKEARRDKERAEVTIDAMKGFANFDSTTWGFIHNQVNAAMSANETKEAR